MNNHTKPRGKSTLEIMCTAETKKLPSRTEKLTDGAGMVAHLLLLKCYMHRVIRLKYSWD